MFGFPMYIQGNDFAVVLRPIKKEEMEGMVQQFASMRVQRFTLQAGAATLEGELEWYERARSKETDILWAISVHAGAAGFQNDMLASKPIGITGLHKIDPIHGSCTSGIIIWDSASWGKGVASLAHVARTWYAARYLNRMTIHSQVCAPNEASLKALLNVGYHSTGLFSKAHFDNGRWVDRYCLTWWNPERIAILFPDGLPDEFADAVKKAQSALKRADELVTFI